MNSSDILNVWYEKNLVGKLWRNEVGVMGFEYDKKWLISGFQISYQIPLKNVKYEPAEGKAHSFFANLLPEEGARDNIVRELKIPNTDFDLLRKLGSECAGALSILPIEADQEDSFHYKELNKEQLKIIILRKGSHLQDISGEPLPRLSLAGAQEKCPIYYSNEKYYLPQGTSPSSHILKFEVPNYKNIPAYEYFLTQLAKTIEIPVVDCKLKKMGEIHYLLITRYDRVLTNGRIKRLHQEDFCQTLGISYRKKYEIDDGPKFLDCYKMLEKICTYPLKDQENLLKWQIFNFLAGNSDGHSKNISIIYKENKIELAPFYDLVCTRAIERISTKLAFSIDEKFEPSEIMLKDWLAFGKECKIKEQYLKKLIKEIATKLISNVDLVRKQFEEEHGPYPALQRVKIVINKTCSRILKEFIV
ncbi:type II toxin-antitoxin system HipA family toxin [Candidatus Berkiella cookevillensis]|uniref:Serine/threonine-protein kinase HipA n=1 Tax=Candidatus Berkiella cookevillensis TaxID=437022 RepID=A0A0Q9YMN2_9GAMM|nr:type II toxin-antitoxin system HipA family toxin [Candidatus Berkiella cookevillensis]MCS5707355.1 type II toxin-antitoxin system HipA family toxin [Candidatus Berkiella cookevillensis]